MTYRQDPEKTVYEQGLKSKRALINAERKTLSQRLDPVLYQSMMEWCDDLQIK